MSFQLGHRCGDGDEARGTDFKLAMSSSSSSSSPTANNSSPSRLSHTLANRLDLVLGGATFKVLTLGVVGALGDRPNVDPVAWR